MKGIVLAGGNGSRLWPITKSTSKQLLPIFDKPLIYYPISTLMLMGVREILIIVNPRDLVQFENLLGNGSEFGIKISFKTQIAPRGIAEALIIGEEFLNGDSCMLILGDNIFYGAGLGKHLLDVIPGSGCHVFTYEVLDPSSYGVLELDSNGHPTSIEEKPQYPLSNNAVTGLYFFDGEASAIAKSIAPSSRQELEITDVISKYLQEGRLTYTALSRGTAWLDTGNPDSMLAASNFIQVIEYRTGLKIACLEEIAIQNHWIDVENLISALEKYRGTSYGTYLQKLVNSKK